MNTGNEKVCRKCGALNDERSLMCIRCGENLEMAEEKKYDIFKGKMHSEILFLSSFVILFLAYSFAMVFYAGPWIYDKLIWFGEKYIFNLFENLDLIYLSLEVLYTIILCLINYISVAIILYSVMGSKLLKKNRANINCAVIHIFMILATIMMLIYKQKFNYVIIIEYFISLIITFPYIKRQILKRSI